MMRLAVWSSMGRSKYDALLEQAGEDVKGPLAVRRLFYNHGHELIAEGVGGFVVLHVHSIPVDESNIKGNTSATGLISLVLYPEQANIRGVS
jgi:hypothetical protein